MISINHKNKGICKSRGMINSKNDWAFLTWNKMFIDKIDFLKENLLCETSKVF